MDEHLKGQVLATYSAYVEAFRANDVAALDELIQYPLAYIGNGRTKLLDAFPIQPAELMATKQWHDTQNLDPEVMFTSADKAHVIVRRATRVPSGRITHRSCLRLLRANPRAIGLEVLCALRHHRCGPRDRSAVRQGE